MIAIKTVMPEKKLKIKFTSKRIEADSGIGSCNAGQQVSQGNDYSMAKTPVPGTNKRGPEWVIAGQNEKRQKIDRSVVVQCSTILKKLMSHEAGWVFKTPVDPVALNIPDYFSIISAPMDLGTVKSKLEKNLYFGIEEFAADVRLTFSNAMLYNPPANHVYQMAKKLNQIFEMRWKVVEDKYNGEGPKVESAKSSSGKIKKVTQMAEKFDKTGSLGNRSEPRRPIPSKVKVVSRSFEASYAEVVSVVQEICDLISSYFWEHVSKWYKDMKSCECLNYLVFKWNLEQQGFMPGYRYCYNLSLDIINLFSVR